MITPDFKKIFAPLDKAVTNKRKDKPVMDRMETLQKYVESSGVLAIAKHICDGGKSSLSEHEFVELATTAAKRDYPNDRPDQAFAKYFEGNEVVRRAHAVVKATLMPLLGVHVGGQSAVDAADDDPSDALAQIEALVAQMRAAQPALSKAQAFEKVYCDPANARLAAAERRQNRPRA
jgi:hypothetical protein